MIVVYTNGLISVSSSWLDTIAQHSAMGLKTGAENNIHVKHERRYSLDN